MLATISRHHLQLSPGHNLHPHQVLRPHHRSAQPGQGDRRHGEEEEDHQLSA